MNLMEEKIINDGEQITKAFANEWEILDYCDQYNGKITISFVGVVIKRDKILFSFPKHYNVALLDDEKIKCMKKILRLIAMNQSNKGGFDNGDKGEFPIRAYIYIANYYKKHGLYTANEKYYKKGYDGNIDWNKTINKSNKIIQKNGLLFFPFVLKKTRDTSVFISECMNYVLGDANEYRDIIEMILPYTQKTKNTMFNNKKYVIAKLKQIKNNYFKDSEKKLIQSLIEYITWKSEVKDNVRLLTLRFENYWEEMIGTYLNYQFFDYQDDTILWGNEQNNEFIKPEMEFVESEEIRAKQDRAFYKIQYDHYMFDEEKKRILLFDSKYFNDEVSSLNYKQLFYHYHLKNQYPNIENIVNGLLLPTSKEYYTKVHIDRTDLDGVKIIEHYINLNDVLNFYMKNSC